MALWTGPRGPRQPRRRSHPLRSWGRGLMSSGMSRLVGFLLALLPFPFPPLLCVAGHAQGAVDFVPGFLKDLDRLCAELRRSEQLEIRDVELFDSSEKISDPVEEPFVRVKRPLPLLRGTLLSVVGSLFQGLLNL